METEELQNPNVHHGHNIRRTRIEKGIKQDAMSELVHLSQPAISRYERTKTIDDEMTAKICQSIECTGRISENTGRRCSISGI